MTFSRSGDRLTASFHGSGRRKSSYFYNCRTKEARGTLLHVAGRGGCTFSASPRSQTAALWFGLHHYPPIGEDIWSTSEFAFRTAAGAYLAAVYVLRGFGLAVGCHIVYDVIAFLQLI